MSESSASQASRSVLVQMLLAGVLLAIPLLLLIYRPPAPQGPVSIQRLCGNATPVEGLLGQELSLSGVLVRATPLLIADPAHRECVARVELRVGGSALNMFRPGAWVYVRATYRGIEDAEGSPRAHLDQGRLLQASQGKFPQR